jgi:hypothetical protein
MSNASRDVGASRGNLTVGDGQGRACDGLAAAGLGHDRDMPEPVIRRLSEGCRRRQAGNSASKQYLKQYLTNAIKTHESLSSTVCDGSAYLKEMCPKFAAPQQR